MSDFDFVFAVSDEKEAIVKLLQDSELPYEDIANKLQHFILAKTGDDIIGVVGLEILGKFGLLRSLVVVSSYRNRGIGNMLFERILAYAHSRKIKELYLLTTTAEGFFLKLGFDIVENDKIPKQIRKTDEFQTLCPSDAICMSKPIDKEVQYYPNEILHLQSVITGAKMWGIALEKTMLTYFEIEPNSRFETHSHESEQITTVLEGKLYFEANEKTICVQQGEVIAIPSNIPHAAYTKEFSVKAVDSWSPVIEKYRK